MRLVTADLLWGISSDDAAPPLGTLQFTISANRWWNPVQVYDPGETDPGAALAQTAQGHIHPHHLHAPAVHTIADEERPARSRKRVTFDEAQVRWAYTQQFGGCLPGCLLQVMLSDLELHMSTGQHKINHNQQRPTLG